jgi:death on curing protein
LKGGAACAGSATTNALESAIAQPQKVYFYGEGDLFEIAAAYAFPIAESQAFFDGNKRTGGPGCRRFS